MAKITINEISDNYTYNIGVNSFATVALPITASWGPAVLDPATKYNVTITSQNGEEYFEKSVADNKWYHFPATPEGLDAFIATFRGATSTYKINKDYSYQEAVTLLTSGYDVLVCRVSSGTSANGKMIVHAATADPATTERSFGVTAKYVGTFGNNIKVKLSSKSYIVSINNTPTTKYYWNVIVYVAGTTGGMKHLESMAAPYKHLGVSFIPLGGLKLSNMGEYLNSPLVAAIGGSWIAPANLIKDRDWAAIRKNAEEAVANI